MVRQRRMKDDSCEVFICADGTVMVRTKTMAWKTIAFYDHMRNTLIRRKGYRLFRVAKSIAFPYCLLQKLVEEEGYVKVEVEGVGKAHISPKEFKRLNVVWYKERGYERQVLIPLELFGGGS